MQSSVLCSLAHRYQHAASMFTGEVMQGFVGRMTRNVVTPPSGERLKSPVWASRNGAVEL
jgi:hypothetical protein